MGTTSSTPTLSNQNINDNNNNCPFPIYPLDSNHNDISFQDIIDNNNCIFHIHPPNSIHSNIDQLPTAGSLLNISEPSINI
jgi:hypothetical protein